MDIIQRKRDFFQETVALMPKKLRHLYRFGFSAFSFRRIESARANARLLFPNRNTAKSKAYRTVGNQALRSRFPGLISPLHVVGPKDTIAVDFSDFRGFQVLLFAKQTRRGRATPVYFEILTYPIRKGSQNRFVISAIERFSECVGFRPRLVFDRGFACPAIIAYLCRKKHRFIVRIKSGKTVVVKDDVPKKARENTQNDLRCLVYGKRLRLVISDTPRDGEPWYLLTNDFRPPRKKIIAHYYHRFEIEEFFRDAKRLLGLEWVRVTKKESLAVLLWFVIIGCWFLAGLKESASEKHERIALGLSRFRYVYERIQREICRAVEGQLWDEAYDT